MIGFLIALVVGLALSPRALVSAMNQAATRGWWRSGRALGRLAPFVVAPELGRTLAFDAEVSALREEGRIADAVALSKARLLEPDLPAQNRNVAIDILVTGGSYEAALAAEPRPGLPRNAREAFGLVLIQINLAEADYNLGRWDAAEARLRPLDLACWPFPISRAGVLMQRAWIAAHRGRPGEALDLLATVDPRWLPLAFRAEIHFARAAALLAEARLDDADSALDDGERVLRRVSSRRNLLFLRARVAAARGNWAGAESLCRAAAHHAFRGQGGAGLLLWADALTHLGRGSEAEEALRLVSQRDPESESARVAVRLLETGGDLPARTASGSADPAAALL